MPHVSDATAGSWGGVHSGSHRHVDRKTPALGRRHPAHSGGWALRCQQLVAQWGWWHCHVRHPYGVLPRHKIWEKQKYIVTNVTRIQTEKHVSSFLIRQSNGYLTKLHKWVQLNILSRTMMSFKSNVRFAYLTPQNINMLFFLTGNTVPMLGHSICLQYRPHCSHLGDEMQRSHSGKKKERCLL